MNKCPEYVISEEVKKALEEGRPVVALESTIISHGMPYPQNVETAKTLENICRKNGVTPATICILDGKICVGINEEQLDKLGNGKTQIIKVSKRDLPIVTARKLCGATTVSSTMYIASKVGIKVFGTGGIGGVHRDQASAMDISNDLIELGKTNVVVVCAGVKSILDIPNTLEYLETQGVPVIGYKTMEMPAFYTRSSGVQLEYSSDSPKDLADIATDKWNLKIDGGVLVVNPIPEDKSYPKDEIDKAINQALESAKKEGISGKRITPYLLKTIVEETGGKSLEANIDLVKNNVELASRIAVELANNEKN